MLIKNIRLLDRQGLFDIRIVDGRFTEIAENCKDFDNVDKDQKLLMY